MGYKTKCTCFFLSPEYNKQNDLVTEVPAEFSCNSNLLDDKACGTMLKLVNVLLDDVKRTEQWHEYKN